MLGQAGCQLSFQLGVLAAQLGFNWDRLGTLAVKIVVQG